MLQPPCIQISEAGTLDTQDEASLYPGPDENTIERSGIEVVRAKNTSKRDQITRRRQHSSESPRSTACENGREAWIWTHSHSRAMILLCFPSPPSAFAASSLPPHTNHSGRSHSQGAFAGTGGPRPARPGPARPGVSDWPGEVGPSWPLAGSPGPVQGAMW